MFISNKINSLSAFTGRTAPSLASILVLTIVFFLVNGSYLYSDDQVVPGDEYQPTPCSSLYPGYYYSGEYYSYYPVMHSGMPYDVLIGNILLDSVMRNWRKIFPVNNVSWNDALNNITCSSDTLNYVMKYLYRLADYDPYLYVNALSPPAKSNGWFGGEETQFWRQVGKICGFAKQQIGQAYYILHIKANQVEPYTYYELNDATNMHRVHCKIHNVIKGQKLPDINSLIEILDIDSAGKTLKKSRDVYLPEETDFIFSYNRHWPLDGKNLDGKNITIKMPEAEENTDYIVFLWTTSFYCTNKQTGINYYNIRPTSLLGLSGGMYPIKNGNVIDEYNEFGWGTAVPFESFMQNLHNVIDSVVNYGE